ncbi:bifunctional 5,10-methylenetetrahydrofolate dehydrogenase/5,10-methenyltetrahydrofolate cyclohydrolase [Candidatus Saccharibacteria bacterium]|nr:bifunctional 5,10-methylenetetrahydrofolate dehydrogenase/5,10-methenyltetrahydrofolate cyclohydrolase [Candidatus Saccharibacteria bacterium]
MKELNGRELAGFIKERQAHQVRHLRAIKKFPKLVIFYDNESPVITKYISLKEKYGADIHVDVEVRKLDAPNAAEMVREAANDDTVSGIIVQLPLAECDMSILDLIPNKKDVDGLRGERDTATAMAIHWLLTGYGVELPSLRLAVVGRGKLVGAPLLKMWKDSNYDVEMFHRGDDLMRLHDFDVIVTATGVPGLITSEMVKEGAVVVDAGTASEKGVIVGDVAEEVRERDDLTITPKIGGVGPLTVAMLFENVIRATSE